MKRLEADGEDYRPDQKSYKRQEQLHAQRDKQCEQEQRQGNVDDRPDAGASDSLVSHVRYLRRLAIGGQKIRARRDPEFRRAS